MAEEPQSNVLSAAFPAPPPFYKYFTPTNLARLKDVQSNDTTNDANATDSTSGKNHQPDTATTSSPSPKLKLQDLPRELLYLIPPEPPTSGIYKSFGAEFDITGPLPSLRSRGIEQVFPTPPGSPDTTTTATTNTATTPPFSRTHHLITLTRSLLLSFLDLTNLLANDPSLAPAKLEDLRVLFLNAHHLINGYRPHQAREAVIEMVEKQVAERRREIEGIKVMQGRVEEVLRGLGIVEGGGFEGLGEEEWAEKEAEAERKREREREMRVWEALGEIEV